MDCILKNKNITLKTFKSWDFADVFQIETVTEKEKIYVIKIICTLCKLHQNKILSKTNGAVRAAALRFINGTNYVKKDSICRHLSGATHQHAIQLENESFDKNDGVANSVVFKNLSTSSCLNSSALKEIHMQNSYRNLVKIAYEMACHPTMPHAHFSVLVSAKLVAICIEILCFKFSLFYVVTCTLLLNDFLFIYKLFPQWYRFFNISLKSR
nr:uncharacterized protein LOC124818309 [Hydra vulgaris]